MKKKFLFFAMTLVASAFFVPNAFAEGNVAKIGDVEYATLQEAVNSATSGATISLVNNTNENITIAAGKNITIDLGTYTLTNVSNHTIINSGKLTITGKGTVDNVTHQKAALYNNDGGVVVINGGTFKRSKEAGISKSNSGGNSYYTILNHGEMTINKATVKNDGVYSSCFENGWYDGSANTSKKNSKLVINDGLYDGGLNTIKNDDYGVIEINGGTYQNYAQAAVLNWNETKINDGKFTSDAVVILNATINDSMDKGILIINGGTFEAGSDFPVIKEMSGSGAKNIGSVTISGGSFNVSAAKLVERLTNAGDVEVIGGTYTIAPDEEDIPEGYKVFENEDGTFVVAKPVLITFSAKGYSESIEIPAGIAFTNDEVLALWDILADELSDTNITFGGFYNDADFTTEFDFSVPFEQDVTIYLKLSEVQEKVEDETNPDTSDINLIVLLGTILLGGLGLGFTLKNRKFN